MVAAAPAERRTCRIGDHRYFAAMAIHERLNQYPTAERGRFG